MSDDLKQKLTSAHAAMGYAINSGNGIREASIALDNAIDDYYGAIHAELGAQAVESYKTQWNIPTQEESVLNRELMALS